MENKRLTDIEQSVLRMLTGEMSHSEIAFALDISESFLHKCIEFIIEKLAVTNIEDALEKAKSRGLISFDI